VKEQVFDQDLYSYGDEDKTAQDLDLFFKDMTDLIADKKTCKG
jgi:hypothetical protein